MNLDLATTSPKTITPENVTEAITDTMCRHLCKGTAAAHLVGVHVALCGADSDEIERLYDAIRNRYRRDGKRTLPEGWALARALVKGWEAIAQA